MSVTRTMSCAVLVCTLVSALAHAELSAHWHFNPITAAAIAADSQLAGMQSWSLIVTHTSGHWASAGVRAKLSGGLTYYHTPPARGGGNAHPTPAMIANFPELEFDTYVSSSRNQQGANPPALLGAYVLSGPPSLGGPEDDIPGEFSVSWGDIHATSGPGPGTYEILRLTFPQGVLPNFVPLGQATQINPDITVTVPAIPEPGAPNLLVAASVISLYRHVTRKPHGALAR